MIDADISILNWRYVIPFLIGIVPFVLSDDLINHKFFYRYCLLASLPWALFGVVLVAVGIQGYSLATITIFFIPLVYLTTFELLRRVYFYKLGENPYVTSVSSVIGGRPFPGIFSKPNKKKRITVWDFAFSFAQAMIPIAILSIFLYWTIDREN